MDNNKTNTQDQIDVEKFHNASNISNLISLFDPDDLGMKEIEIIAEATNSTPEFINNLVNINHSAIKELGKDNTSPEQKEQAMQTFSLMKESVIGLALENNNIGLPINFSSGEIKNRILNTIEMTRFVNPQILNNEPITDLAVAFSSSTFVPQDICEDILSKAKEQFSQGDVFSVNPSDVNEYEKEMNFSYLGRILRLLNPFNLGGTRATPQPANISGTTKKYVKPKVNLDDSTKERLAESDRRGLDKLAMKGKDTTKTKPQRLTLSPDQGIRVAHPVQGVSQKTVPEESSQQTETLGTTTETPKTPAASADPKTSAASAAPAAAPAASETSKASTVSTTNDLVNKLNSQNRNLKIGLGAAALGGLGYMGYKLYQKHKAKAEAMRQAQAMYWQRQMQAIPQYPNGMSFSNDPLAGTSLRDETEAHQGEILIGDKGSTVAPVSNLTPLDGVLQSPSEKVDRTNEEDPSNSQEISGILKQELNKVIPGNEVGGNFNNSFHIENPSSGKQNNLITLLGDKYIPNK